ncbi:hypothetical protein [Streptomyces sp. NPDC051677]|uniref:hypothetical protein n=1 Tax=Streptomyces sp. NPDC051677 TaxID=3365669 RepID=UPI0037D76023
MLGSGTRADRTARRSPEPDRHGAGLPYRQDCVYAGDRVLPSRPADVSTATPPWASSSRPRRHRQWALYGSCRLDEAAGAAISASGALELVARVGLCALAVFAAIAGSRPLLRRVTADPARSVG